MDSFFHLYFFDRGIKGLQNRGIRGFHDRGIMDFQNRGVMKMTVKLFEGVKYHEVIPCINGTNGLKFDKCDIRIDVDNGAIMLDTDNGRVDIKYDNHDMLLDAVSCISMQLYSSDMLDALNKARDQLTTLRRYPWLEMEEREVANLLIAIEKAKDHLLNTNFTVMLKLGDFEIEDIDVFIKSRPEAKRAIEDGIERYKELCWEVEDADVDCDNPIVYETVYAVPESKRIISIINVDPIGEVYRSVKGFDSAYDFLKSLEGYVVKSMTQ